MYAVQYETVAAGQTAQVLGSTGGAGDWLEQIVCSVGTAATGNVQIKDGGDTAYTILPASPGGGIGVYVIPIKAASVSGAWQITTGAGVTVLATGRFV